MEATEPFVHSAGSAGVGGHLCLGVGTTLDGIEVGGLLSRNRTTAVYLAHDRRQGQNVVLKEYRPASLIAAQADWMKPALADQASDFETGLDAFVEAAQAQAQIEHPALVQVHRVWRARGSAYFTTPRVQGQLLSKHLSQLSATPPESWIVQMVHTLAGALQAVHAQGLVHRGVNPGNVMLDDEGQLTLLDMAPAHSIAADRDTFGLPPNLGFTPLEQSAHAERRGLQEGPWSDLYALSALVYCAILGEVPPPAPRRAFVDTLSPLARQAEGRYNARLLQGLDRGLALDASQRPASVAEYLQALGLAESAAPTSLLQAAVWPTNASVAAAPIRPLGSEQASGHEPGPEGAGCGQTAALPGQHLPAAGQPAVHGGQDRLLSSQAHGTGSSAAPAAEGAPEASEDDDTHDINAFVDTEQGGDLLDKTVPEPDTPAAQDEQPPLLLLPLPELPSPPSPPSLPPPQQPSQQPNHAISIVNRTAPAPLALKGANTRPGPASTPAAALTVHKLPQLGERVGAVHPALRRWRGRARPVAALAATLGVLALGFLLWSRQPSVPVLAANPKAVSQPVVLVARAPVVKLAATPTPSSATTAALGTAALTSPPALPAAPRAQGSQRANFAAVGPTLGATDTFDNPGRSTTPTLRSRTASSTASPDARCTQWLASISVGAELAPEQINLMRSVCR